MKAASAEREITAISPAANREGLNAFGQGTNRGQGCGGTVRKGLFLFSIFFFFKDGTQGALTLL